MSDFSTILLKSLLGGGQSYATQDQPWNPAAGLYNGSPLLGQQTQAPAPQNKPGTQSKPQGLLGSIGSAIMPQTMGSMGKGGGV